MKKQLLGAILLMATTWVTAQNDVCACYDKVKNADRQNSDFQSCLDLHRSALKDHEERSAELYKQGDRAKMKELVAEQKEWKKCYLPDIETKPSKLSYQFADSYGVINIQDIDVDFTDFNEYTKDAYITLDWADYDTDENWKRPEGASTGSICIIKKQDSLANPSDVKAGDYTVKRKDNEAEWMFYINYNIKGNKYSGQYNGAQPSTDSYLKVTANNGRFIELEFSLITEDGNTLKGAIQAIYPFQSRG